MKRPTQYRLGIDAIDRLTDGFEPGELIIFTGYSGHGKTSIAQTLTVNFEHTGVPTMWFSYEVTPIQFFGKFKMLPKFYLPRALSSSNLQWIGQKIDEGINKFGIKIVFIDHLHYLVDMMPNNGGANNSLVIGSLVRDLKKMALAKEIVIVLIAHTGQPKDDKAPDMNSIRDSSFIAQEADAVFAINRIKERKLGADLYSDESNFLILKHRRKGTMGRRVKLQYKDNIFYESIKQD